MRILLTNHFPFQGSGTGTGMFDLAVGLAAAGHDVRCLIVDHERNSGEAFPVRRLVCRLNDPQADLPFDFPSFTSHPKSHQTFYNLSDAQLAEYRDAYRQAIDEEVALFDPHVIHCQHIWVLGALALETGVPYVISAQGTDLIGYRRDPRYALWAEQAAENASRIIADSRWIADEVLLMFNVDAIRLVSVPGGIDVDLYQGKSAERNQTLSTLGLPSHAGPLVACGGKLVESQGVDVLLRAAQLYEARLPGVMTAIAGDGPDRDSLVSLAGHLGLRRTFFVGDRPRSELGALYQIADLVVIPARTEPIEFVALEALACGAPLLVSDVGSMPELIRDELGGLTPIDDPSALAANVQRALSENWKSTKGPYAARYAAKDHNKDLWVRRHAAIYQAVLDERFG